MTTVTEAMARPITKKGTVAAMSRRVIEPRFHQIRRRITAGKEHVTVLLRRAPQNAASESQ